MILYNSASHKREEFVPFEPGKVSMYTCGPTVYHFAHIGNLRTYIMEDILDRYLRYAGTSAARTSYSLPPAASRTTSASFRR